jgi:hypothetical protein
MITVVIESRKVLASACLGGFRLLADFVHGIVAE